MNSRGPLFGQTIAVTRPRKQAEALCALIAEAGGTPLFAPLLEISPPSDQHSLRAAREMLGAAELAIFISPNAVDYGVADLPDVGDWRPGLAVAAIGPGTEQALRQRGAREVILPEGRFDSESLLAMPQLLADRVAGKQILIFRGEGGRALLAETLAARGAHVVCAQCYRRSPPQSGYGGLVDACLRGELAALTLSSSEGLRHFWQTLDQQQRQCFSAIPVFVPHARIADVAHSLGMRQIVLTGPADVGMIAGLCAYNWPKS